MNSDSYFLLFVIAGIIGALMLIVSVILFFKLRIPKVVGDLTGSNARKAIDEIRQKNIETGNKAYKPSQINLVRGKLTDKITSSGKLTPNSNENYVINLNTEKLSNEEMYTSNETEVLTNLEQGFYYNNSNETTVLENLQNASGANTFTVEVDITYTQTNEVI